MRAVVDTNVLVSALLTPGGLPAALLAAVLNGQLRAVVCEDIVAEYRLVLQRPRFRFDPSRVAAVIGAIRLTSDWVPIPAYAGQPPLPDPTDWPFLAAATVAGCPVITGNARHFPEGVGVRVMTVREWVGNP
ncbi:MAG: PIN domain-containing protein [Burkholderiales bacterium]